MRGAHMSNEQTSTAEAQPLFAKRPAAPKEGGKSNVGLIVGICAGVGIVLIVIIVLIIVLVSNSGKSITCTQERDVESGEKQVASVTVKYDNDDKLVAVTMYEETTATEDIKDEEYEQIKKEQEDYDKDRYTKYSISKKDSRTIRLDAELKLTDAQKKTFETPEKAKENIEKLGFTCKD